VTVYVDDMRAKFGRMVMCHMLADTTEELLAMADRIGVARKWLQKPGTDHEHFDIALSKRAKAVAAGAKEVTMRDVGRLIRAKRFKRKELFMDDIDGNALASGGF
jgi:hypothetical protein